MKLSELIHALPPHLRKLKCIDDGVYLVDLYLSDAESHQVAEIVETLGGTTKQSSYHTYILC